MNIFDLSFTGILIKAGWMSIMTIVTGLLAWRIAGLAKRDDAPVNDSAQAMESARVELAALEKDAEIKRLNAQLADTQARQDAYENRLTQLKEMEKAHTDAESDAQRDKAEIEIGRAHV